MYSKSKLKSEQIKKLFEEGVILTEICNLTSSSSLTVKKVLLSFGIDYNSWKEQDYQDRLNKAVDLYRQGKAQLFIEQECKLTRKTIRTLLKSQNLKYRDRSEQHHIRYNTEIDHNCFDQLTPESLYWIGMLFTDGSIGKSESCVELTQHTNDIEHLRKLKMFLKSSREISTNEKSKESYYKGRKIYTEGGNTSRLRVNSKKIHNRLIELGITPNKSLTAKPHELVKNSSDFWRGCIDGDGGVYHYPERYTIDVSLNGTLETIFDFIIFCSRQTGVKEKYPTRCLSSGESLYQVHYYGEDCRKILILLYKDATVYLDRKYAMAMEIINTPANLDSPV